jgi:hypothetical protein
MLRATPDPASLRLVESLLRFVQQIPQLVAARERRAVQTGITRGFARNFGGQTSGLGAAWAPLALVTQKERQRKGYGASRPILVRSGAYRAALVNPSHALHYSATGRTGSGVWMEEGSEDMRVATLEGGRGRIPARPATQLSPASEDELGRVIDGAIVQLETVYVR